MEKKISFGFSKSIKKTTLQPKPKLENLNKLQLVDSIEGQSIKIKNELPTDKGPLVIPLKKNETRLGNNEQDGKTGNDGINSTSRSLDEIAAEEILNDLKNARENKLNSTTFAIPSKKDKTNADGGKEVTLDDYEDVPISEFGRAMLRGMGWKDEDAKKKTETVIAPRPKGLGLGADKLVKLTAKVAVNEKGEELKLIKGAFVKVVGGRHKDHYGQVDGMDDERGVIFVKMAIGREILTLSEFLLTPVPKTEYEKNSKVLNMTKYEEYKNDKKKSTKLSERTDSRSPSRNRSRSVSRDREKHSSRNKISDEQYEKIRNRRGNSSEDNESSNYSSRNKDRKNFERRRYQNDKEKRVKKHSDKRSRSRSSSDREQHSSRKKNNEKPSRRNRQSDTDDDDDDRHSNHKKYKEKSHSRSKHSRRRSSTDSETKDKYSKYKKERNSTERYKTSEQRNENDNSNEDKHASRHKRDRSVERSRKNKYETNYHKHSSKKSKRRSRSRSR